MSQQTIRIGCGAGFWGDSAEGPRQLVENGALDYLVFDYLAEITMSLLAKARAKDPSAGYASDFPDVIARLAPAIKAQGIKVVSNAGGVNPQACRQALQEKLAAQGIALRIGIVTGDDLLAQAEALRAEDVRELFSGETFPAKPWSINAYLGAVPIAAALDAGADIVITGRCVDTAVALGPLIHEFGWGANDYHRLSMGSLAGHIIECGAQATGGIVTDWEDVADDWHDMGFPIAVCAADGSFEITKPEGTGGRVTPATVGEQIIYEIGDPACYLLPDVTCDWRQVRLQQVGENRVAVRGALGSAPTGSYKVSATFQDGFRASGTMMLGGPRAVAKAQAVAAAILKRTRRLFAERGHADYLRTDVEVLGGESNWGAQAAASNTREVVLKVAVHHAEKAALELFSREFIPAATSMAQGITGFSGGRPNVTPLVRLFSCLVAKDSVPITVDVGGDDIAPSSAGGRGLGSRPDVQRPDASFAPKSSTSSPQALSPAPRPLAGEGKTLAPPAGEGDAASPAATEGEQTPTLPLHAVATGRSGDKGNSANIGILARHPALVPLLREQLTAEAVRHYLAHFVEGTATRYELPGLHAFNFLLHQALGGGGMASLRYDPQGKMLAQILMDFPLQVPANLLAHTRT